MGKRKAWVGLAVLLFAIVLAYLLLPKDDPCADQVRGFQKTASATVDGAREGFHRVTAAVKTEDTLVVGQKIENLTAAGLLTLQSCDTQCHLLTLCMRWHFFSSPSIACPTEYKDYQSRSDNAMNLLTSLQNIQIFTVKLASDADALKAKNQEVEELRKSSGSTGGRLQILSAQLHSMQTFFDSEVRQVGTLVDATMVTQAATK